MKGRSLWSALMLAWLGATNTATLPEGRAFLDLAASEREADGDDATLFDVASPDDAVGSPASVTASKGIAES